MITVYKDCSPNYCSNSLLELRNRQSGRSSPPTTTLLPQQRHSQKRSAAFGAKRNSFKAFESENEVHRQELVRYKYKHQNSISIESVLRLRGKFSHSDDSTWQVQDLASARKMAHNLLKEHHVPGTI